MSLPDEPDNTCPLIDAVIEEIDKLMHIERNAGITFDDIDFKDAKDTMEEIRRANAALRERSEHFESLAEERETERDIALERAEKAEAELNGLTAALARHLERIAALEAELVKAGKVLFVTA